ncbi:zinc metalloprotease HtpX [bacterium]|nr:zinc metalloprotease HtpX [bacterium]
MGQIKTLFLLITLSVLLVVMGDVFGGSNGALVALMLAGVMNFIMYFFSDKLVLRMYSARPLDQSQYAHVYDIVDELCHNARMPMPKLFLLPTDVPNAFATGRNPRNASVAVTHGIMQILDEGELRGVLAHELSHVKNRDILIGTIAATLAAAIAYLADMMRWSMIFGGGNSRDRKSGSGFGAILAIILIPLVAMLVQMAISRSREYLADESGAKMSDSPLALASALEKLQNATRYKKAPGSYAEASTASLFIVYPFSSDGLFRFFSTHPPMKKRIERLHRMAGI